jgi:hypothetical protein
MKPAGFMSKKFTNVQRSYFTYEYETLGAIEALKKWDNELLGLTEIRIVTDHEALKTFMLKAHSGPRQIRWSQWFSRYRLKFIHIPGLQNRSADALSRLFENLNSKAQLEDLSTVDLLLDKNSNNLTEQRLAERKMFHMAAVTCAKAICEVEEPRILEANAMVPPQQEEPVTDSNAKMHTNDNNLTVVSSTAKELPVPFVWQNNVDSENHPNLEKLCQKAYPSDRIFKKILSHLKDHKSFEV